MLGRVIALLEVSGRVDHLAVALGHKRLFVPAPDNGTFLVMRPVD